MSDKEKEDLGLVIVGTSAIITAIAVFASIGDFINNRKLKGDDS